MPQLPVRICECECVGAGCLGAGVCILQSMEIRNAAWLTVSHGAQFHLNDINNCQPRILNAPSSIQNSAVAIGSIALREGSGVDMAEG